MAIFVTGDTHGGQPHGRFSVDGFMRRFSPESFPEQRVTGFTGICTGTGG